jgi:hypothetical protein
MEIDIRQPEGNAFAIMGVVRRYLRQTNQKDKIEEVLAEMMSGDYENLCEVAENVTHGAITFTGFDE